MIRRPPRSTLFPYTTLFRSDPLTERFKPRYLIVTDLIELAAKDTTKGTTLTIKLADIDNELDFFYADRKSTRLNSSHANISYAVFCLKKKQKKNRTML